MIRGGGGDAPFILCEKGGIAKASLEIESKSLIQLIKSFNYFNLLLNKVVTLLIPWYLKLWLQCYCANLEIQYIAAMV